MSIDRADRARRILAFERRRTTDLKEVLSRMINNCSRHLERIQCEEMNLEAAENKSLANDVTYGIGNDAAEFDSKNLGDLEDIIDILFSFSEEDKILMGDMLAAPLVSEENIWGVFDGVRLMLHTPLLPPGGDRSKYHTHRNKYAPSADYGHPFVDAVNKAMSELLPTVPPEAYRRFATKTVSFYYVYPSYKVQIPDSDRYDTKAIIDAVTGWLPGGDAALSCSLTFQSIQSDVLMKGTYIVVRPSVNEQKGIENDLGAMMAMRKNDDLPLSFFRMEN